MFFLPVFPLISATKELHVSFAKSGIGVKRAGKYYTTHPIRQTSATGKRLFKKVWLKNQQPGSLRILKNKKVV